MKITPLKIFFVTLVLSFAYFEYRGNKNLEMKNRLKKYKATIDLFSTKGLTLDDFTFSKI